MAKKTRTTNARGKTKASARAKQAGSAAASKPDAGQMTAIERLLGTGRYQDALSRAQALSQAFPGHSGLWRMQIDALQALGDEPRAALLAYRWARQRPNSVPAQQALLEACLGANHLFLAVRTIEHLRALNPTEQRMTRPPRPDALEEFLVMPDGTRATPEQMEQFDCAQIHLNAREFDGALSLLEPLSILSARNNRGVCLFNLGRIDEARAVFDAAWRDDPDNLFALSWVLQLRLYRGDEDGARGLATPLAVSRARRADDAMLQLQGLLLIGEDQAANAAFERASGEDWFGDEPDVSHAWFQHLGACAACRVHQPEAARERWKKALRLHTGIPLFKENLAEIARCSGSAPAYPSVLDSSRSLPLAWLERMQEFRKDEAAARIYLQEIDAANVFLKRLYLAGNQGLRALLAILLRLRAKAGDGEASAVLKSLITLPAGSNQERLDMLNALRELGAFETGDLVDFWGQDGPTKIKLFTQTVYHDPTDSGLPPDLDDLLDQSIEHGHAGRHAAAEDCLRRILRKVPDHPIALGNLAMMRVYQGAIAEGEELLERTVERHPDYLHARCNLAQLMIAGDRLERAKALLAPVTQRSELHAQDYYLLVLTNAMLLKATGDPEGAQRMIDGLEQLVEDNDDAKRIAAFRRMLNQIKAVK